ncbi:MAG: hypothetical protein ACKOA9_13240 [Actinomycetota bacterium]
MTEPGPERIRRLVGVYDADHTLRGELAYWVGARLGRAHCALCDVSHGRVRRKREWDEFRATLPVPFDTFHRDDQPAGTRALGPVPVVAAETDRTLVVLLDPAALEECAGSVERFAIALRDAAAHKGLDWPDRGPGEDATPVS